MAIGDLVKLNGGLESPRQCKPSDFPAVGPTGAEGSSSGAGQLVKQTDAQMSPRRVGDSGDQKPSVWGKDEWKVGKSSSEAGTSVSFKGSVDLKCGQMVPCACDQKY